MKKICYTFLMIFCLLLSICPVTARAAEPSAAFQSTERVTMKPVKKVYYDFWMEKTFIPSKQIKKDAQKIYKKMKTGKHAKIKEIHKLMDEEEIRIKPELEKLNKEHSKRFVDTSDIDDLIDLGNYINAYLIGDDDKKQCEEVIQKLLNSDKSLYDRYIKWQGSDEYMKEFR